MIATPVIAIFDVGKTNKKLLLFDEAYQLVLEESEQFPEITDEDGFMCENIQALTNWIGETYRRIKSDKRFERRAVNFSAYGASFVHLDDRNEICAPLYNYLRPFPADLQSQFYDQYGGETSFSAITASPVLGNLNSGMQLYWLKHQRPDTFARIRWSLHLPQYLSYILSSKAFSDLTSIGCHTNLWNFERQTYHQWVTEEGIDKKLAPVVAGNTIANNEELHYSIPIGVGLHDSSAALIPYLESFEEPFVLISTGTWCISLNPFNKEPLSSQELQADCLCYLSFKGDPVKASRLFAGHDHEQWISRLAAHFNKPENYYKAIRYRSELIVRDKTAIADTIELNAFDNYEEAYHQIMFNIILQQKTSTELVLKGQTVKRIFVDGGFSKNEVYMNLLASAFRDIEVFAASVAQSTGMGAAIAIHGAWNNRELPSDIIQLKYYSAKQQVPL